MKTVKYFFVSFLVVMLLCVSVLAIGQVVDPEPALSLKRKKIFGFFKDIDRAEYPFDRPLNLLWWGPGG